MCSQCFEKKKKVEGLKEEEPKKMEEDTPEKEEKEKEEKEKEKEKKRRESGRSSRSCPRESDEVFQVLQEGGLHNHQVQVRPLLLWEAPLHRHTRLPIRLQRVQGEDPAG